MTVNTSTRMSPAAGSKSRIAGPDTVRAFALIGVVVMNYHGYLILRGAERDADGVAGFFDPWVGPLATRFAATFVLVAGVGVTLLTRRSLASPDRVVEMRWRLIRRGAVLYVLGVFLEEIWPGTIIPYYGAMFVLAAALFTLRSRWILGVGALAAIAGAAIRIWRYRQAEDGLSTAWLTSPSPGSISDHVFGTFVNGTHPLLPWLVFLCAGIVLGRILDTPWWRHVALSVGAGLFAVAGIVGSTAVTDFQLVVLSTDPGSRGVVYVASALGTALVAYAVVDVLANRFPAIADPFRRAGQMTLTLYLAHIFVFNFVVDWVSWIQPAGVGTSLGFALGFWVVGIVVAAAWHRRLGRGPAERVYRALGG